MTIQLARQQLLSLLFTLYEEREATTIADWVLEHLTQKKKTERLLHKDQQLTSSQVLQLASISQQLSLHKPVQYILEEAWFAGMRFYVNESTLIPRPETEELVELAVSELAGRNAEHLHILDIGSGSGCIPIALKKKLPDADIISIDVSEAALQVAQRNAIALEADIRLLPFDFLNESKWNELPPFNAIISNPPYIKQSESASMAAHVLDFEPAIALFVPDEDALLFYRKIAALGKTHLLPHGILFMEINEALGSEVIQLFEQQGYRATLQQDLQGKDRMIKAAPLP